MYSKKMVFFLDQKYIFLKRFKRYSTIMIKIIVTGGLGFIGSSFINLCSKNKSIFI